MNQKPLSLTFVFFLVVPISFAITLDELIAGYNFTETSNEITVTNIAIGRNDTNASNSLTEQLLINLTVQATAANFSFNADLKRNGNFLTSSTDYHDLTEGQHLISIPIDTRLLSNGTLNATITIQKKFLTIYRNDDIEINFNNQNFTKPEIQVAVDAFEKVSVDVDDQAEIIRINGTIIATTEGIYEFRAFLKSNNISISTSKNFTLNNNIQPLELDFNTSVIRKNRIKNATLYSIFIKNGLRYIQDQNLNINYNVTDLDPQQSLLEDSYTDGLANNNDSLQLNISVFALVTKSFNLTVELRDEEDNFLLEETQLFSLNAGSNIVQFDMNGTDIYNTKTNGPYTASVTFAEDGVANAHTTKAYNYNAFTAPPLPDLTLNSASISSNGVAIEVENQGNKAAVAFTVKLFNENFTEIAENVIDIQQPTTTRATRIDVDVTNQKNLFVIVDHEDDIEEEDETNNLFLVQEVNKTITIIIQLQKNWNLFSLPLNITNTSIQNIFNGKNISKIYTYNASTKQWELYTNETSNNFTELKQERAYWVNANEDVNLSVSGTNYSSIKYSLYGGWNLISFPALAALDIGTATEKVNSTFSSIFSHQNRWLVYNNARPNLNNLKNFSSRRGYWIKATQNTTWTFNSTYN